MISIVVLNWNTTKMLVRLYETIKKFTSSDYEVIVLDNGSRIEELKALNEYFKSEQKVKIIEEPKNLGFAAGNNKALLFVSRESDFIVFINSDIYIQEDKWDEKFKECFKDHSVAICGAAYHPLSWDKNGNFHIQPLASHPVESESVQGAFFALRYNIALEIGLPIFDEAFKFAQYEETDLCFRVRKLGYKVMWIPVSHIHDHNNSSTKKNGYHLSDEIKNIDDFKKNAENNKKLLLKKHGDFLAIH